MTGEVHGHETRVSLVKAPMGELCAGSDITLKVKVSCPSGCDLQGCRVRINADEGLLLREIELVAFDGAANETAEFIVKAPTEPGEYRWTAVFAAQEKAGVPHEGSSAPFSFVVESHATSMAVWHVPSPVVVNAGFSIKVGVRCSAACKLAGKEVAIYDQVGRRAATGTLGEVPWSDTGALYWAEVELEAPGAEGYYTWEAEFPKPDLDLLHERASYTFAFRTTRQPEHAVTVEVLDQATNAPISRAEVILHPYREHTDERGLARLMVPKGEYELYVSALNWQLFRTTVGVSSDLALRAELLAAPVEDTSG